MDAHANDLEPWVCRVLANLKRWVTGVFHGFCKAHRERYLQQLVFRWNRSHYAGVALDTLLGIAARLLHASYRDSAQESRPEKTPSVGF